jgi:tRNA(Ile)-lysidine synthase TilS/MesJ
MPYSEHPPYAFMVQTAIHNSRPYPSAYVSRHKILNYLVDNWNLNENITRTKLRTELNRLVEKGTILQKGQSFKNYSYKHL